MYSRLSLTAKRLSARALGNEAVHVQHDRLVGTGGQRLGPGQDIDQIVEALNPRIQAQLGRDSPGKLRLDMGIVKAIYANDLFHRLVELLPGQRNVDVYRRAERNSRLVCSLSLKIRPS